MAGQSRSGIIKILVFVVLAAAIGGIYFWKNSELGRTHQLEEQAAELPMLVEFGSDTCAPCRQMEPILTDLREEYRGRTVIKTVDVYEERERAVEQKIRVIPTQIFFDSRGNEVFRHEGFMPKEEIIAVFKEMGVK